MVKGNKELIILSQYFYPEVASTGQLLTELAEDLVEYGYKIKVYTGKPSYYKNVEKYKKKEFYHGIEIHRLFNTNLDKNSKLGKIFNSLTYFISIVFKLLSSKDRDPLLIVSNPPFLPIAGLLFNKIKKQKYIFLIHDIYPDIAIKLGYLKENSFIARVWDKFNYHILRNAERIIVLGEYMAGIIKRKYLPNNNIKIEIIHNWADEEFIIPIKKENNWFAKKNGLIDKFVILYSGNIGLFQDLETIIKTAVELKKYKEILFLFIGDGGGLNKLKELVKENNLTNVIFLPYQPKEFLPHSLTACDISIVPLEKGIEGLAVPSKIYGILASGRAVLGLVGENCEVADIIKSANCGFRVNQGDVSGLIEKIIYIYQNPELLKNMGKKSRQYFEKYFTRSKMTREYYKILEGINPKK
jgi:glycosyltransferase involved in cell wall biosynthesis